MLCIVINQFVLIHSRVSYDRGLNRDDAIFLQEFFVDLRGKSLKLILSF